MPKAPLQIRKRGFYINASSAGRSWVSEKGKEILKKVSLDKNHLTPILPRLSFTWCKVIWAVWFFFIPAPCSSASCPGAAAVFLHVSHPEMRCSRSPGRGWWRTQPRRLQAAALALDPSPALGQPVPGSLFLRGIAQLPSWGGGTPPPPLSSIINI